MRDVKTIESELNRAWERLEQFEEEVDREKNKIKKLEAEIEEAKQQSYIPLIIKKGMIFRVPKAGGYYYMVYHNGSDLSLMLLSSDPTTDDCVGCYNSLVMNSQGVGPENLRSLLIKNKAEYKGTLESFSIKQAGGC
jgi:hypothetical protein